MGTNRAGGDRDRKTILKRVSVTYTICGVVKIFNYAIGGMGD